MGANKRAGAIPEAPNSRAFQLGSRARQLSGGNGCQVPPKEKPHRSRW
jgi:hypothetical protein